jgi:hypothetical protein
LPVASGLRKEILADPSDLSPDRPITPAPGESTARAGWRRRTPRSARTAWRRAHRFGFGSCGRRQRSCPAQPPGRRGAPETRSPATRRSGGSPRSAAPTGSGLGGPRRSRAVSRASRSPGAGSPTRGSGRRRRDGAAMTGLERRRPASANFCSRDGRASQPGHIGRPRWTISGSAPRSRRPRGNAAAPRLAVLIPDVGDVRRRGEGPDRRRADSL